jgi:hypothetical protein
MYIYNVSSLHWLNYLTLIQVVEDGEVATVLETRSTPHVQQKGARVGRPTENVIQTSVQDAKPGKWITNGQWYSLTILITIEVMIISVSLQQPFTPVIDAFTDTCQNANLQQGRRKASSQSQHFSLLNVFGPGPQSRGKSMGTRHVFDRRCQSRRFACRCTLHSRTAIPSLTLFWT